MTEPVTQCQAVSVSFGGVKALQSVDFQAMTGDITAIIGPNGAGKTTLLNVMSGMIEPSAGRLVFANEDITRLPAHVRSRRGMVRTFQNLEIFSNMTVLENVMTGCHARLRIPLWHSVLRTPRSRQLERRIQQEAEEAMAFVGLSDLAGHTACDLAFGKQRLLELARALAAKPRLLLLDEPAAGLNIAETQALADLILRIRSTYELSILLVEHDMDLVMRISDAILVLCFGEVIDHGSPAQIQKNPRVIAAYLGADED